MQACCLHAGRGGGRGRATWVGAEAAGVGVQQGRCADNSRQALGQGAWLLAKGAIRLHVLHAVDS
jgi:hypothetical protein